MDSFGTLKNNSFGDFNKEDVLGFIDEMTRKTKKAEVILRDRVDVLNREREHLVTKISAFDNVLTGLEQNIVDEQGNIRRALMEKDELRKKISVERAKIDSLAARKQKEFADCEREILEFIKEREDLNAQMSDLENKTRRYDDIKARGDAIRLEPEPASITIVPDKPQESVVEMPLDIDDEVEERTKALEETQEQVKEAVQIISGITGGMGSTKQQFADSENIEAPASTDKSELSAPIAEPSLTVDKAVQQNEKESVTEDEKNSADDSLLRLDALYKALDESMERLQEIKEQFIQQNSGFPDKNGK